MSEQYKADGSWQRPDWWPKRYGTQVARGVCWVLNAAINPLDENERVEAMAALLWWCNHMYIADTTEYVSLLYDFVIQVLESLTLAPPNEELERRFITINEIKSIREAAWHKKEVVMHIAKAMRSTTLEQAKKHIDEVEKIYKK